VVIFPGQDAPLGTRFAKPAEVAAPAVEESAPVPEEFVPSDGSVAPLRRFDAPGAVTAPTAINPAATQDPAEAERALRSALATLQRMSGAA
jgi:hypothetical protein